MIDYKEQSEYLKLHWRDVLKSFVMAFLSALIAGISLLLQKQDLPNWLDIKILLTTSLSAAVAYIAKNLFTNSKGQLLKKEPEKVNEDITEAVKE
jgi:branched-subunit amino acid transport protein